VLLTVRLLFTDAFFQIYLLLDMFLYRRVNHCPAEKVHEDTDTYTHMQ